MKKKTGCGRMKKQTSIPHPPHDEFRNVISALTSPQQPRISPAKSTRNLLTFHWISNERYNHKVLFRISCTHTIIPNKR